MRSRVLPMSFGILYPLVSQACDQWETGVFAVVRIGRYFHRYFNSGFPQFAEQPDGERICIMERAYID